MKSCDGENILLLATVLAIEKVKGKSDKELNFLINLFQAISFQIAALSALKGDENATSLTEDLIDQQDLSDLFD